MESSACRRRASDAKQPARSYPYTVPVEFEPAMVKEEPEWGECGVSEAAAAEGLYDGHEVKDVLVIGPELLQKQDITFSMHNMLTIKEENQHKPKPAGGADACNRSTEQQYGLRSCFVRLERLPASDLHRSTPFSVSRDGEPSHSLAPSKLKPVHCGVGNSRARDVPASCQPHPSNNLSTSQPYLPKFVKLHTHEKPEELAKQMLTHTAKQLFCCDACRKQFGKKSSVGKQAQVKSEKPYSCEVCEQRFKLKSELTRHIRTTHYREKRYRCDLCNKWFLKNSLSTGHKLIKAFVLKT